MNIDEKDLAMFESLLQKDEMNFDVLDTLEKTLATTINQIVDMNTKTFYSTKQQKMITINGSRITYDGTEWDTPLLNISDIARGSKHMVEVINDLYQDYINE